MKTKPTEAQIDKLGKLWIDHLERGLEKNRESHNIAYVYEKQFDVNVEFLELEGRRFQPCAVKVNGKIFKCREEYDEYVGPDHPWIDASKKEPLPDELIDEIGNQ